MGGTTSLEILVTNTPLENEAADDIEKSADEEGFADEPYGGDPFGDEPEYEAESDFADDEDSYGDDPFADDDAKKTSDAARNYWLTVSGLKRIEAIHSYLESQPEVGKVQSLATLYNVGKDINGGLNDFELALLTRSLSPQVKDVLLAPFVPEENTNQTRITLRVHDTYPNLNRKDLVERLRDHVTNELGYAPEQVRFTGLLVLYNNMLQSLFSSQIVTLGAVFAGIIIMFIILFRSLTVAVVSIVPNILAALAILGTMGLLGLPLDMMTITVAAITVGIGVDDTIHYIHRFKEELKVDGDYVAAMHRAHSSIGRAMAYTSIIIVFGFAIMVLSEFIPTIYFGLLTGLAMFYALMGALLLLPKLILWLKPFPAASQQN